MKQIQIPKAYYDDHILCEQEAPPVIKETKNHYYISSEEVMGSSGEMTTLDDLYTRARCYSNPDGYDSSFTGLCRSARWTVEAIDKYRKEQGNE